mgnify:CR=1 FL=1
MAPNFINTAFILETTIDGVPQVQGISGKIEFLQQFGTEEGIQIGESPSVGNRRGIISF